MNIFVKQSAAAEIHWECHLIFSDFGKDQVAFPVNSRLTLRSLGDSHNTLNFGHFAQA